MKELYLAALGRWGKPAQLLMAVEEMAELSKEICKHLNRDAEMAYVIEEAADVMIMMEQIRELSPLVFDEIKARKLERLHQRLSE